MGEYKELKINNLRYNKRTPTKIAEVQTHRSATRKVFMSEELWVEYKTEYRLKQ